MKIDERLLAQSTLIKALKLSDLRLIRDGELSWFMLIPRRENITEVISLERTDRIELMDEIALVSKAMQDNIQFDKLNIGALGNMVPQLHIHIIARLKTDRAWPNAIWGTESKKDFDLSLIDFWKNKFKG